MAHEEVNKRRSLPPYPEMILRAIAALDEPNGSNKSSISKYIESTYGDVPAGHSALLSHHLSRMKDSGELVFWRNNYTKADPNAPPRRGRGRPPKPKGPMPPGVDLGLARPPKDPDAPPKPPKVKLSSGSGKPRGRPRKMARPAGGSGGPEEGSMDVGSTDQPRGQGRPPISRNAVQGNKKLQAVLRAIMLQLKTQFTESVQ